MVNRNSTIAGAETEYGLTMIDLSTGKRISPETSANLLIEAATRRFTHIPSAGERGIFLLNGGKLYIDSGSHPEWATPETTNPFDLVRYTLAGDRMMAQLIEDLSNKQTSALIFRGNTSYHSRESFGSHESYLCNHAPMHYLDQMAPFLASRIIFTGSGGFDPFSPGISFTLSPRAHFLKTVASLDTVAARPLFNLKDEPHAESFHRLHLICSDALGSETAMWLRTAATALVVRMVDLGLAPFQGDFLHDPIAALRTWAGDATLTATVSTKAKGRRVGAIQVQRMYADCARAQLHQDPSSLPDWAPEAVEAWQTILLQLESDPEVLDTILDWRIKQTIFRDYCERKGVSWSSLLDWSYVMKRLNVGDPKVSEIASEGLRARAIPEQLRAYAERHGLDLAQLRVLPKLRSELLDLDTRWLQIGGEGIFDCISEALNHRVLPSRESIQQAVDAPPAECRSALRGSFVKEFAGKSGCRASWTSLYNGATNEVASLQDPFEESLAWRKPEQPSPRERSPFELRQMAWLSYVNRDWVEARTILLHLLAHQFEPPSTLCHLARVDLATGCFDSAAVYTERASECMGEGPPYVAPRVLWLQIALSLLRSPDRPIEDLLARFRQAVSIAGGYDWSIEHVLEKLEQHMSTDNHTLLRSLSLYINSGVEASDAYSEPRDLASLCREALGD